jgi:hypothetical protein
MNTGRVVAGLLVGAGLLILLVGLGLLGALVVAGVVNIAGFVVGVFFVLIVAVPVMGAGIVLFVKAGQDNQAEAEAQKQRKILEMVATRGELRISDAAIELKATREQIQSWVYNLVGLGVFSGYINWDDGVLYSAGAAQLKSLDSCKKCGGKVSLAGKGVIKCQYCGTEYFV